MSRKNKGGNWMSLGANKVLVRRHMEEVFNNKHLDVINETVAPDFDDHTNSPDWPAGREGHRQIIALFHSAFPDLQYTIEHEVAEGGMVVIRFIVLYSAKNCALAHNG